MGTFLLKSRGLRTLSRAAFVGVMSFAVGFAPVLAQADQWSGLSSAANGLGSNAGAMNGLGALTSAQGANSMLKGKQQMQCCKEGCDGAGKEATANKAGQDAAANAAAEQAPADFKPSTPSSSSPPASPAPQNPFPTGIGTGVWNFHVKEKPAAFLCSRAPARAKMIFDLFRPQRVEAAAGCNDAMSAMAQGAMQMLSGLAGLAAGMMGGQKSNTAGTSAGSLSNMPGSSSETPSVLSGTSLGGTGNTTPVQIDPSLLRDGKANSIYSEFEKNFGISRDDFANALLNGADPRAMLMNAPKNAFTADELNQAFAAAKNMSQDQKNAAMAGLSDLQRQLASKAADAFSGELAAGGKGANKGASKGLDDLDLLGADANKGGSGSNELSPELQAALAEKSAAEMREQSSIFKIVHDKYQQKVRMIYGFDAHGRSIGGKGIADANGF